MPFVTSGASLRHLPLFFAYCPDRAGVLAKRLAVRPGHLARWKEDLDNGRGGELRLVLCICCPLPLARAYMTGRRRAGDGRRASGTGWRQKSSACCKCVEPSAEGRIRPGAQTAPRRRLALDPGPPAGQPRARWVGDAHPGGEPRARLGPYQGGSVLDGRRVGPGQVPRGGVHDESALSRLGLVGCASCRMAVRRGSGAVRRS